MAKIIDIGVIIDNLDDILTVDVKSVMTSVHRHTVNVLSALPLTCLDVLVSVQVDQASHKCEGVNMDCVHNLLLFMNRRLNRASEIVVKESHVVTVLV